MAKVIRIVFFICSLAVLHACSDENPTEPPKSNDPFADCGNDEPISSNDSAWSMFPWARYRISELRISSYNGYWAGTYERHNFASTDLTYASGVFLYDPHRNVPITGFTDSWGHSWSPDGKTLLFTNSNTIYTYNQLNGKLTQLTEPEASDIAYWSVDGKHIYYRHYGTYVMNPDGSEKRPVTDMIWRAKVLDASRLVAVYKDTLRIFNIPDSTLTKIYKPEMDPSHHLNAYDISPDSKFIIFQTQQNGGVLDPWGNGVWLMHTKTWTAKKIRGAQWWGHEYYPTWASDNTFYASVFCRKDSSSMIWEFDLNGNPIRQITTKEMRVWLN